MHQNRNENQHFCLPYSAVSNLGPKVWICSLKREMICSTRRTSSPFTQSKSYSKGQFQLRRHGKQRDMPYTVVLWLQYVTWRIRNRFQKLLICLAAFVQNRDKRKKRKKEKRYWTCPPFNISFSFSCWLLSSRPQIGKAILEYGKGQLSLKPEKGE